MNTQKIILIVGGVAIGGAIAYFIYNKKGESIDLTIQQIFDQLYLNGSYLEKVDVSKTTWNNSDLPYLRAWLDASNKKAMTFLFNGVNYKTLGGKLA